MNQLMKLLSLIVLAALFQACNLTDEINKNSKSDTVVAEPKPSPSSSPSPSPTAITTDKYLEFDYTKMRTINLSPGSGQFTYDITKDLGNAIISSDNKLVITDFETDFEATSCEKILDENNTFYAVTCKYDKGGDVNNVYKIHSMIENGSGLFVDAYAYLQVSKSYLELKKELNADIYSEGKYTIDPNELIKNGYLESNSENVYISKYDFSWSEKIEEALNSNGNISKLTVHAPKVDVGKTLDGAIVFRLEESTEIDLEVKFRFTVTDNMHINLVK